MITIWPFVPVPGYLNDLILIPLGIALALKTVPPEVMAESREKARAVVSQDKPRNWVAAAVIVTVWVLLAVLEMTLLLRAFTD